jgi:hypothetical protein
MRPRNWHGLLTTHICNSVRHVGTKLVFIHYVVALLKSLVLYELYLSLLCSLKEYNGELRGKTEISLYNRPCRPGGGVKL